MSDFFHWALMPYEILKINLFLLCLNIFKNWYSRTLSQKYLQSFIYAVYMGI